MVKCLVKIRTKVNVHLRMVNHCYRDVRVRVLSLGPRILRRAIGGMPFLPALMYGPPSDNPGAALNPNSPVAGTGSGASRFRETPRVHEVPVEFDDDDDDDADDCGGYGGYGGVDRAGVGEDEDVVLFARRGDPTARDEAGLTGRGVAGEGVLRASVRRCSERSPRGSEDGEAVVVAGPSRHTAGPPRMSGSNARADGGEDLLRPLPPFPTKTPGRAPGLHGEPSSSSGGGGGGTKRSSLAHHSRDAAPLITNGGSDGGALIVASIAPCAPRLGGGDATEGGVEGGGQRELEGAAEDECARRRDVDERGRARVSWARAARSALGMLAAASLLAAANLLLLVLLLESPAELESLRWMRESPFFLHFHYGYYCPARRWLACSLMRAMGDT
uniref:Uncharacterized protein LOC116940938 isoform X2 n=1 Tax=Petromyzon marinus TaxID=7757 RepID=A0AAJ7SX75_PETMA|nr:uncharacterized protein LOC116940938 isoform X2 [Petromyzon marinus]